VRCLSFFELKIFGSGSLLYKTLIEGVQNKNVITRLNLLDLSLLFSLLKGICLSGKCITCTGNAAEVLYLEYPEFWERPS